MAVAKPKKRSKKATAELDSALIEQLQTEVSNVAEAADAPSEAAAVEASAEAAPVVSAEAPPAPMYANLADLWQMRCFQAEKREAQAQAEASRLRKLYLLLALDPKGRVLAQEKAMEASNKKAEQSETQALLVKRRIEGAIGRSLQGVGMDFETGEIQVP